MRWRSSRKIQPCSLEPVIPMDEKNYRNIRDPSSQIYEDATLKMDEKMYRNTRDPARCMSPLLSVPLDARFDTADQSLCRTDRSFCLVHGN